MREPQQKSLKTPAWEASWSAQLFSRPTTTDANFALSSLPPPTVGTTSVGVATRARVSAPSWPTSFLPQQWTRFESDWRMPQVWFVPTAISTHGFVFEARYGCV